MPHKPTRYTYLRGGYSGDDPYLPAVAAELSRFYGEKLDLSSPPAPDLIDTSVTKTKTAKEAPKSFFWRAMEAVVRVAQVLATTQTVTAVFSRPLLDSNPQPELKGALADSVLSTPTPLPDWLTDAVYNYAPANIEDEKSEADSSYSRTLQTVSVNSIASMTAYANQPLTMIVPGTAFTVDGVPAYNIAYGVVTQSNLVPLPASYSVVPFSRRDDSAPVGRVSINFPAYQASFNGRDASNVAMGLSNQTFYLAGEGNFTFFRWLYMQAPSFLGNATINRASGISNSFVPANEIVVSDGTNLHASGLNGNQGSYLLYKINNETASAASLYLTGALSFGSFENVTKIIVSPINNFTLILTDLNNIYLIDISNGSLVATAQLNASSFTPLPQGGIFTLYTADLYAGKQLAVATVFGLQRFDVVRNPALSFLTYPLIPPPTSGVGEFSVVWVNSTLAIANKPGSVGATGIYSVDLSNPYNPMWGRLTPLPYSNPNGLYPNTLSIQADNTLFVIENNLMVYSVSDPLSPVFSHMYQLGTICPSIPYSGSYSVGRRWVNGNRVVLGVIAKQGTASQPSTVYNCYLQSAGTLAGDLSVTISASNQDRGTSTVIKIPVTINGNGLSNYVLTSVNYRGLDLLGSGPQAGTGYINAMTQFPIALGNVVSLDGDTPIVTNSITTSSLSSGASSLETAQISLRVLGVNDYSLVTRQITANNTNVKLVLNTDGTLLVLNPTDSLITNIFTQINASTGAILRSYSSPQAYYGFSLSVLSVGDYVVLNAYNASVLGEFLILSMPNNTQSPIVTLRQITATTFTGFGFCPPSSLTYKDIYSVPQLINLNSANIQASNCLPSLSAYGIGNSAINNEVFIAGSSSYYLYPRVNGIPQNYLTYNAIYHDIRPLMYSFNQNGVSRMSMRADGLAFLCQDNIGCFVVSMSSQAGVPSYTSRGQLSLTNIGSVSQVVIPTDNPNLAFVACSGNGGQILIVSLASPQYPVILNSIPMPAVPSSIVVSGDQAWVALNDGSIRQMSAPKIPGATTGNWQYTHMLSVTAPLNSQGNQLIQIKQCDSTPLQNCYVWSNPWVVPNRPPVPVNTFLGSYVFPTNVFTSVSLGQAAALTDDPDGDSYTDTYEADCVSGTGQPTGTNRVPFAQSLPYITVSTAPGTLARVYGTVPSNSVQQCVVYIMRDDGHGGTTQMSLNLTVPYQPPVSATNGFPSITTSPVTNLTIGSASIAAPTGLPVRCRVSYATGGMTVTVDPVSCVPLVTTVGADIGTNSYAIEAREVMADGVTAITGVPDYLIAANIIGFVQTLFVPTSIAASTATAEIGQPTVITLPAPVTSAGAWVISDTVASPPQGFTYSAGVLRGTAPVGLTTYFYDRSVTTAYRTSAGGVAYSTMTQTANQLNGRDSANIVMLPLDSYIQNNPSCTLIKFSLSSDDSSRVGTLIFTASPAGAAKLAPYNPSTPASLSVSGQGSNLLTLVGPAAEVNATQICHQPVTGLNQPVTVTGSWVLNGGVPHSGSTIFSPQLSGANPLARVSDSTTRSLTVVASKSVAGNLFTFIDDAGSQIQASAQVIDPRIGLVVHDVAVQVFLIQTASGFSGTTYSGTYLVSTESGSQGSAGLKNLIISFDVSAYDPSSHALRGVLADSTPLNVINEGPAPQGFRNTQFVTYTGHNNSVALFAPSISPIGNNLSYSLLSQLMTQAVPSGFWIGLDSNTDLLTLYASLPSTATAGSIPLVVREDDGHGGLVDTSITVAKQPNLLMSLAAATASVRQGSRVALFVGVSINYAEFNVLAPFTLTATFPQQYGMPSFSNLDSRITSRRQLSNGIYEVSITAPDLSIIQDAIAANQVVVDVDLSNITPFSVAIAASNGVDPDAQGSYGVNIIAVPRAPLLAVAPQNTTITLALGASTAPIDISVAGTFSNPNQLENGQLTYYNAGPLPAGVSYASTSLSYVGALSEGYNQMLICAETPSGLSTCIPFSRTVVPPPAPADSVRLQEILTSVGTYIGYASAAATGSLLLYNYLVSLIIASCKRNAGMKAAAKKMEKLKAKQANLGKEFPSLLAERDVSTDSLCALIEEIQADIRHERYSEADMRAYITRSLVRPKLAELKAAVEDCADDPTEVLPPSADGLSPEMFFKDIFTEIEMALSNNTSRAKLYDLFEKLHQCIVDRLGASFSVRYLSEKVVSILKDLSMLNLQRKVVLLLENITLYSVTADKHPRRGFEDTVLGAIHAVCGMIAIQLKRRKPGDATLNEEADAKTEIQAQFLLALLWYVFMVMTANQHAIDVKDQLDIIHSLLGVTKAWYKKCCSCSKKTPEMQLSFKLEMWMKSVRAMATWLMTTPDGLRDKLWRMRQGVKPGGSIIAPPPVSWLHEVANLFLEVPFAKLNEASLNRVIDAYMKTSNSEPQVLNMYRAQLNEIGKMGRAIKAQTSQAIEIREHALYAMNEADETRLEALIAGFKACEDDLWVKRYVTCLKKVAEKGPTEAIRTKAANALQARSLRGEVVKLNPRAVVAAGMFVGRVTAAKRAKSVLAAAQAAKVEASVAEEGEEFAFVNQLNARRPRLSMMAKAARRAPTRPAIAPWGSGSDTSSVDSSSSGDERDYAKEGYQPRLIPRRAPSASRSAATGVTSPPTDYTNPLMVTARNTARASIAKK